MKKSIISIIYISLLIVLLSPKSMVKARFPVEDRYFTNTVTGICPPVQNTPFFSIVYGSVTLNGSSAPVGSLVQAYSPRNDLVGCFSITSSGNYGAMYIYGEDTTVIPAIPGMRQNEAVYFTIDGIPASPTPILLWTSDKDLHAVNLASMGVTADFTATPVAGVYPLVVQFTDASSGSITSRQWDFGDGQTSAETNPQHTFSAAGTYTVSLTVSGAAGTDTKIKTNYVSVYSAVHAAFSSNTTSGIAPLAVSFTNSSTGSYTNLSWNFGDGVTSTATNPVHSYSTGGVYTVALTASGPGGTDTETKLNYITVYTPVTAGFTVNSTSGVAPLNVNFTNTSSGDYTSLSWSFGDGGTSTAVNPSHTYTAKGVYTVSLTASGPGGTNQETAEIVVYAPAVASFNAAPASGVAPLSVTFTNTSTGDFSSSSWDFGDGSTSTETSPVHSYSAKGSYTVTLTVSGTGGSDSEVRTGLITVYTPTQAQFSGTPTSGIAPLTVTFSNQSSGDYTSLSWDFGDGGGSTLTNPSHEFTTGGTYSIGLTASGPGGTDTEIKASYITVYTPVTAGFTASTTSGIAPLQVAFTNQSTGSYTSFSWDFGDGDTSNEANPTHIYTAKGVYTVSLTASGPGGTDIETRTSYITVYQAVSADFIADETDGIAPFEVAFSNLSSGDFSSLSWNFGDGGTSTETNPTHIYNAGGTFTVSLTASGVGGSDQEIKTAYITVYSPVTAGFTYTPETGIAPLSVTFTNTSTGDYDTLTWDFVDGSPTSSETNPLHVFLDGGVYPVILTTSGPGGVGIQTHNVIVYDPVQAAFRANVTSGIAPLEVGFSNESLGDYETIAWDFGDSIGSDLPNPTHIYTTPGLYSVELTVSGLGGSDIETKTGYIVVYAPAAADFLADSLAGIAPHSVQFTDLSTGDYDTLGWEFGDSGTSSEENPQHLFTQTGIYTVSLTVTGNGGTDTETKTDYITIYEPVVADFTADSVAGIAPLTVNFTQMIAGDFDSAAWNFGDGSTSEEFNPMHEYSSPGIYNVSLTAYGPGGTDNETKTGYITVYTRVVSDFSGEPVQGIAPLIVAFSNLTVGDFTGQEWTFGDGYSNGDLNPSHEYTVPGTYTVTLTSVGPGGTDTETKTDYITVYASAQADFTFTPASGTAPLDVNFTNTSTGDYSTFEWIFGDGQTSVLENPMHTYTTAGVYSVSLTVSGNGGESTSTQTNVITVYEQVVASFTSNVNSGVAPLTVVFTDTTTGNPTSWSWDFGDGSTSTEQNPSHEFATGGVYTVTLTATGPGGTDSQQEMITVYSPVHAGFSVTPESGYAPLTVQLTNLSTGDYTSLLWDFGDGTTSVEVNPSHTYYDLNVYTISLTVSGPGGTDVFQLDVRVIPHIVYLPLIKR